MIGQSNGLKKSFENFLEVTGEGFNGFNGSNLHKVGHDILHVHCICERCWQLHNPPAERSRFDSEYLLVLRFGWRRRAAVAW